MTQFKTRNFTFFAPRTVIFCENPARLSLSRHSDRVKRRYTSGTVHEHDVSGRLS